MFWLFGMAAAGAAESPRVVRALDVARVWSGHPVGFDLLTVRGQQFAAFWDEERRLTVASRNLGSDTWRFARLPQRLGWDSHNSIVLAADGDGYLHLSGNMHVHPLVYFRTTRAWHIDSFEALHRMTGVNEERCTYPVFLTGPAGELIFTYRDGRSGSGNQIYNRYDRKTRAWQRLLDQSLTDGQGRMNAYFHGPVAGPDGYFHMVWVWRDTPDCATNHDLTYARSKDLRNWETSAGQALALPIRVDTGDIVDPVPPGGGIINGCAHIGFDRKKRVVITYHKFDQQGKTQVYQARREEGRWKQYQTSQWDYRWEFQGGGAIPFEIRLGAVRPEPGGGLRLEYRHVKHGYGAWRLDEATLKPVESLAPWRMAPAALSRVESAFPGMEVQFESGVSDDKRRQWLLRWETLGPNRDRPRTGPLPDPSLLRLYQIDVREAGLGQ